MNRCLWIIPPKKKMKMQKKVKAALRQPKL